MLVIISTIIVTIYGRVLISCPVATSILRPNDGRYEPRMKSAPKTNEPIMLR